jgi:hypothetical protein
VAIGEEFEVLLTVLLNIKFVCEIKALPNGKYLLTFRRNVFYFQGEAAQKESPRLIKFSTETRNKHSCTVYVNYCF